MAAKKTKERAAFTLGRSVRTLPHKVNFRRMNYPEVESTVQYSTVQYDVKKRDGGKGREEGDQARFFTWILILKTLSKY